MSYTQVNARADEIVTTFSTRRAAEVKPGELHALARNVSDAGAKFMYLFAEVLLARDPATQERFFEALEQRRAGQVQ